MLGMRIAALGLLLGLMALAPRRVDFLAMAWSLALGHYLLAVVYSRQRIEILSQHPLRWLWLGGFVVAVALLWETQLPLLYYFGLHHVLNEVYMLDRVTRARDDERVKRLRGAGLVMHTAIYAAIVHRTGYLEAVPPVLLLAAMAVTSAVFVRFLVRARPALSGRERLDHLPLELFAFALVVLATGTKVTATQVATYHFFFWVIYPAWTMRRRGGAGLGRYALATAGVTGAALLFSPVGLPAVHLSEEAFKALFVFGSYFHITMSFGLSEANPEFVRAAFRVRGGAPAPATG